MDSDKMFALRERKDFSAAKTDNGELKNSKNYYKFDCSIEEMTLKEVVHSSCMTKNSVLYHTWDVDLICEQYEHFIMFVSAAGNPFKSQLAHFVYPLFVHFYLELIVNEMVDEAKSFYSEYSSQFKHNPGYDVAVDLLSEISSVDDMERQDYFKIFREEKYIVKITDDCRQYLMLHLKKLEHTIILQILNLHFSLESNLEEGETIDETPEVTEIMEVSPSLSKEEDDDLKKLEDAISKVSKLPMYIPSIYMCSISTNSSNLCSAAMSLTNGVLAGGFEESYIRLWKLSCDGLNFSGPQAKCKEYADDTILYGHNGPIYGISFTPNGEHMLSCSSDATILGWNVAKLKKTKQYIGHNFPIWDIDVSPHAWYFASGSKDTSARLWTMDRTNPLHVFYGHNSDVNCVKFHPNCNYLATGSSDQTIRLWSVQESNMVRMFVGHQAAVRCVAFSPDGYGLASAGDDHNISLWDIRTSSRIAELEGHKDIINSLVYNNEGTLLASGSKDCSIKLWDVSKMSSTPDSGTPNPSDNNSQCLISSFQVKSIVRKVTFGWKTMLFGVGTLER